MKTILLYLVLFLTYVNLCAQDIAIVYIYRQPGGIGKHQLFINTTDYGYVHPGSKIVYKTSSTEKQEIRLDGYSLGRNEDLDIQKNVFLQPGNVYYLRVSFSNYMWNLKDMPASVGKSEFDALSDKHMLVIDESGTSMQEPQAIINTKTNPIPVITSDVDINIPVSEASNENKFALIIGNEDYTSYQTDLKSEVNVAFAKRDAEIFKEYCEKTLGIPNRNITLLINGTSGQMNQALSRINLVIQKTNSQAEIIFYYAGHGLPDEKTQEAYLVPVDVSGTNLESAIKLNDVYKKLSQYPSKQVIVFLDACFSGGARNAGLVAARSVKIKPKETTLSGNLMVLSASSGDESSLPFNEKSHGLFTYYLLKKIQETKGNITVKELHDYIKDKVGLESVLVNSKEQNPQLNVSPDIVDKYTYLKLK